MRFLADENFPGAAVYALARAGHDVVWVATVAPGTSDGEILEWAVRESRIVLTFDKDFGEIARGASLSASSGIVLFRLPMPAAAEVGSRLASLVSSRSDWLGHFSVVEPDRVRMRPLPKLSQSP
jgi:predicted nuclease of predicted toxin-antitoxin system